MTTGQDGGSAAASAGSPPNWGIGVDGDTAPDEIVDLAVLSERLGYGSFWINVTHRGMDVIGVLTRVARQTTLPAIGVGVVPLDQIPAESLVQRLKAIGLNDSRVVIGLGSGRAKQDQLSLVRGGIRAVRSAASEIRVAVGAIGPRMMSLGASEADAVVLSMTPTDRARSVDEHIAAHGAAQPYLYHRVAEGSSGRSRLREEMIRLGAWKRGHKSGDTPIGTALEVNQDLLDDLARYPRRWTPVLWPLWDGPASTDHRRRWLRRLAPRAW